MTAIVIEGSAIAHFQLRALYAALKLEALGMRRSCKPSAYIIIKRKFGWKGNKAKILMLLKTHLEETYGQHDRET